MRAAAERHGIQVAWNLCHYGWPDDVDLFQPAFVNRFAGFAAACARHIREHEDRVPFFTPVNEISFFSWAAARYMFPFAEGRDNEMKEQLVRAAIEAMAAIRNVDRRARFIHGEPIINVVPARRRPDLAEAAARYREAQYDAWDMIAGRKKPGLGGHPSYLDIIGCNFYHDNQWQIPSGKKLAWHVRPLDDRWIPLHRMLEAVHKRYGRPMLISETSHIGVGRGRWIKEIAVEVCKALSLGVPLEGVCLYPILDRPDWQDPDWWHHSGLWDLKRDRRGVLRRVLSRAYAEGLRRAQQMVSEGGC
jgi:beta-glucosidase/6-phospho-beta-glucosidase/beta-galactosidase